MVEECKEKYVFAKDVVFECHLEKGHYGFHSDAAVFPDKTWWSFRWGNANEMIVPDYSNDENRGVE